MQLGIYHSTEGPLLLYNCHSNRGSQLVPDVYIPELYDEGVLKTHHWTVAQPASGFPGTFKPIPDTHFHALDYSS